MIEEIISYTVKCDNCGWDVCYHGDHNLFPNKDPVEQFVQKEGWIEDGENYYCPYCWKWNDSGDKIILPNGKEVKP